MTVALPGNAMWRAMVSPPGDAVWIAMVSLPGDAVWRVMVVLLGDTVWRVMVSFPSDAIWKVMVTLHENAPRRSMVALRYHYQGMLHGKVTVALLGALVALLGTLWTETVVPPGRAIWRAALTRRQWEH